MFMLACNISASVAFAWLFGSETHRFVCLATRAAVHTCDRLLDCRNGKINHIIMTPNSKIRFLMVENRTK